MSYSPYLPRTPQTARSSNGSTPTTPRLGYRGTDKPSPRHHYVEMLVQGSDNQSDTCSSTALYSSPAHLRLATYGTLQTDISKTSSTSTKQHILIADSATPSDDEISYDQTVALNRPVAWVWMVMNLVAFALCLFSILQPYWLVNKESDASLGVLNHCQKITNSGAETDQCFYFNTQQTPARLLTLASLPWKIGLILCLISCILLAISGVLAALCLCVSVLSIKNKLSLSAGYQQLIAAIFLLTALVIFPVGFDAPEVQSLCGVDSKVYSLGNCSIGWSYVTMGVCSIICCILPVFSHYISHVPKASLYEHQRTQF